MSDFTKPALTSTYTNFITELKARDNEVASLFSSGATFIGTYPARAIKWDPINNYFIRRNTNNTGWERLETNTGTHNFVNVNAVGITATAGLTGATVTSTGQVMGNNFRVTGAGVPDNGFYLPAANKISLTTNSSNRLTILSTGEVGIGTTAPTETLTVLGRQTIYTTNVDAILNISALASDSSKKAYIDIVTDTTYTDYGLRLIRNAGENAQSNLLHRGTGNFVLETQEAADIRLKTNSTRRFIIDSGGNIGFGDLQAPSHNLHIKRTDASGTYIRLENSEGSAYIGADGDALQLFGDRVYFFSENGNTTYLDSTSSLFDIKTAAKVNGNLEVTGTINASVTGTTDNANDINIDEKNDNVTYQITFSDANGTSYQRQYIDTDNTNLTYNPSTALLSGCNAHFANLQADGTVTLTASNTLLFGNIGISASGNRWGVFTPVGADGVMEIGRYIDFHIADNSTVDSSGRIDCDGNYFYVNKSFLPMSGSHSLGSSSARWQNLYVNDLKLSNKGGANDVDGTWGDWTLQEAENNVYMLNNRNGKKYKINMTEVDM